MTSRAIIDGIQQRAGLESPEAAHDLATAVLANVSRFDLAGQEQGFAAELPQEYGDVLVNDTEQKDRVDAATFVRRVADRMNISPAQSETWTRAALSLLVESVSPAQHERIVAALPEDIKPYTIWHV